MFLPKLNLKCNKHFFAYLLQFFYLKKHKQVSYINNNLPTTTIITYPFNRIHNTNDLGSVMNDNDGREILITPRGNVLLKVFLVQKKKAKEKSNLKKEKLSTEGKI